MAAWPSDEELLGALRTLLADRGWSGHSIEDETKHLFWDPTGHLMPIVWDGTGAVIDLWTQVAKELGMSADELLAWFTGLEAPERGPYRSIYD